MVCAENVYICPFSAKNVCFLQEGLKCGEFGGKVKRGDWENSFYICEIIWCYPLDWIMNAAK